MTPLKKKEEKQMKIKIFNHHYLESVKRFEKEINDFMKTVEVVDVKHSIAPWGNSQKFATVTSVIVLYK